MQKNINKTPIVFVKSECKKNSNSIIIQLKERIQKENCRILTENNNNSILKTIKENNKTSGVIINADDLNLMIGEEHPGTNLILAIRRANRLLPIFLIRKDIIVILSPYSEKRMIMGNHYKCNKKEFNWENIIWESIDSFINKSITSIQPIPDEPPVSVPTCCVTSSRKTGCKNNSLAIENEFIDYFYKKIVEDKHIAPQEKHKSHTLKETLFTRKNDNKKDDDGFYHLESVDYFTSIRNGFGMSGLIPPEQFELKTILNTLTKSDKKYQKYRETCYEIMRMSTSDGLIYNITKIIQKIYDAEIKRQFNEEWALFNDYHPFFNGVFSKSIINKMRNLPPLYAAKSIHHILSALSSSIPENHQHKLVTTEKPTILLRVFINAIKFRKAMLIVADKIEKKVKCSWFFNVWQPNEILFNQILTPFRDIPDETLMLDASFWQLNPNDEWHGFDNITKNYAILDPTKVTLLCPGQNANGSLTDFGIPAMVIVRFLENKLIIPQKSNNYSFLFDLSSESTPVKWQEIIETLLDFKKYHDSNVSLDKIFPALVKRSPFYTPMGLADLCEKIHITMRSLDIPTLFNQLLQTPKSWHNSQYQLETTEQINAELVSINNVMARTIAVTVSSDAVGMPMLTAGEKITENNKVIIDYLLALQIFDQTFPGFEHTLQGIWRNVYGEYFVKCLIDV